MTQDNDTRLSTLRPANTDGGVLLRSTDALTLVALLCAAAFGLVAVALFAPLALLLFAILGAAGLNTGARRWRAAEPV